MITVLDSRQGVKVRDDTTGEICVAGLVVMRVLATKSDKIEDAMSRVEKFILKNAWIQ